MRSGGGSSGHIGMHVGEDWWTFLSTYDDHPPILDISCGSMTVAVSIAGQQVGEAALEFARDLATKAATFAAEVERLHARYPGRDVGASASGGAGDGEAA
jgi:hypothetical protein